MATGISSRFIEIAPENPVLRTEMKGVSAESRKNESDAETSSDLMIEKERQVSDFRV
jgi:hypothetical protein